MYALFGVLFKLIYKMHGSTKKIKIKNVEI